MFTLKNGWLFADQIRHFGEFGTIWRIIAGKVPFSWWNLGLSPHGTFSCISEIVAGGSAEVRLPSCAQDYHFFRLEI